MSSRQPIRPIQNKVFKAVEDKTCFEFLAAAHIISDTHMIPVEITGSVSELSELLEGEARKALWKSGGYTELELNHLTHENYQRIMQPAAKNLADRASLKGNCSIELMFDQKQLVGMLKGRGPGGTWTDADYQKLSMTVAEYRETQALQRTEGARRVGNAVPMMFHRSMFAMFQCAALAQSTKAISRNGADAMRVMTLVSDISGLASTTFEGLEKLICEAELSGLRFGYGLSERKAGLRFIGRAGAVVGGVLVAIIEWQKAKEDLNQGNVGLSVLHGIATGANLLAVGSSAIAWGAASEWGKAYITKKATTRLACQVTRLLGRSIITDVAVAGAAATLGEIAFFAGILIELAIAAWEREKFHTWLKRSCWGSSFKNNRFHNLGDQNKSFEEILKMY